MNLHLPTLIYHIEKKIVVEIFKIPHIILTFKKNKGLIFAMEKHWSCTVNFWPFLTMVTHTHTKLGWVCTMYSVPQLDVDLMRDDFS